MRCFDKPKCQDWYDKELQNAKTRLERLRDAAQRLRPERRSEMERQLDELRGRLNRASARAEGLRRASAGSWNAAAAQADEAFNALRQALDTLDSPHGPMAIAA
ncbi:hypothetical protein CCP1ISM_1330002 [Azospirillaceae bacterium]